MTTPATPRESIRSSVSTQLAILGFLLERDYHGYELKKTIERKMGMWTDIKFGSLYYALSCMEKDGWVRRKNGSRKAGARLRGHAARSVLSITPAGREAFRGHLAQIIETVQRVYLQEDIGVYFGNLLPAEDLERMLRHRAAKIRWIIGVLKQHRERMDEYSPEKLQAGWWLVTHHIRHLEVEMGWLRELRTELKRGRLFERMKDEG